MSFTFALPFAVLIFVHILIFNRNGNVYGIIIGIVDSSVDEDDVDMMTQSLFPVWIDSIVTLGLVCAGIRRD